MSVTISGANFNKEEVNQDASININSNKSDSAIPQFDPFQGVTVSGSDNSATALQNNTYESLMNQADDVKAQIQASATTAKDSLKALVKRLSGADAVKIDEDGFNLNDATEDDMVDIVDRIKIELAASGQKVYSAGAGISTEQIEKVTGSAGMAQQIENSLQSVNLPVSEDNVTEMADAVSLTDQMSDLSENAKNYLVSNQLSPSIDNVYKAQHMQDADTSASPGQVQQLTDEEWSQLQPQIEKVLTNAGLDVNEQNLNNAKNFIQQQIPATAENLVYKEQLDQLDLEGLTDEGNQQDLMNQIAQTMANGESAGATLLTGSQDFYGQVADVLTTLDQADYRHVQSVIDNGETFTIQSLKEAIYALEPEQLAKDNAANALGAVQSSIVSNTADAATEAVDGSVIANVAMEDSTNASNATIADGITEDVLTDTETTDGTTGQSEVDSKYMQLQEVRFLMTANSGLYLAKQGIDLYASSISDLITELNTYYQNQFNKSGVLDEIYAQMDDTDTLTDMADIADTDIVTDTDDMTEAQQAAATEQATSVEGSNKSALYSQFSAYQAVTQVRRALHEISQAPDITIGAVLKDAENDEALTISNFAETGSNLRQRYEQAGETYEAVGTTERKDLGDSLKKAVKASTEPILNELGLESTQANQDAVRILAANQMEITEDSINQIKEINGELNNLIDQMKPETVLKMIRDNIDPMNTDISEVNEYLEEQNQELDSSTEKYSKFLYKLDQSNEITQEERDLFIGVYKMINVFTKDAGDAIGALVKQNADITMSNLCTAYNSRKASGIDETLDETSGLSEVTGTVNYYNNLFQQTGSSMTPLSMKQVNEDQPILQRSVENFCESVQDTYDSQEEQQYYAEYLDQMQQTANADQSVLRELSQAGEPATLNQISAMEQIMQTGFYNGIVSQERSERYVDSIDDREELETLYAEEKEVSDDQLTEALSSDENQTYDEINTLRMQNREIGLIQNLSVRHDYRIPFATEDGVGTINLTLVQDQDDAGRISIQMKEGQFGDVSVEAKVSGQDISLYCVSNAASDQKDELQTQLDEISDTLKEKYQMDNVTVQISSDSTVNRIVYPEAADSVATDRLYQIAKDIVVGMIS